MDGGDSCLFGNVTPELQGDMKLIFVEGGKSKKRDTLHETNIAPENGWLEYEFSFGKAYFQGYVSFWEGIPASFMELASLIQLVILGS